MIRLFISVILLSLFGCSNILEISLDPFSVNQKYSINELTKMEFDLIPEDVLIYAKEFSGYSMHFQIDNDKTFIRYYTKEFNSLDSVYKMIYEKPNLSISCNIDIVTLKSDSMQQLDNDNKFIVFNSQKNQFFTCSIFKKQDSSSYIFTTEYKYPYYQE